MNARRADGGGDGNRRANGTGRNMIGNRKQAVSIRMSRADVRQIKQLADRLGVRDSDVVRYAIKTMLARLAPLPDQAVRGRALLPVFVEAGADLMRHFDIDVTRLAEIINDGADTSRRVDAADIQLIAMSGTQAPYAKMRIAAIGRGQAIERAHLVQVNGGGAERDVNGAHRSATEVDAAAINGESTGQSLRQYIYEKYLYSQSADQADGRVNGT
jgi:hypothetical protein